MEGMYVVYMSMDGQMDEYGYVCVYVCMRLMYVSTVQLEELVEKVYDRGEKKI